MHRTIRLLLLILAAGTLPLLAGCWDRREVNDVAFVAGTAFDKAEGKYRVSVQIPLPSQLGGAGSKGGGGGTSGDKSWYVDSASAETVREANGKQQQAMSRQLYFAHRRVAILGEELSREGIGEIMDIFIRTPQNRLSAIPVVSKGEARDTLNIDAPIEQFPAEMIRELAQNATKEAYTLRRVTQALLAEGMDPLIPFVTVEKTASGPKGTQKSVVKVGGLSIFRDDRLVGFIEGKEAPYLLIAMNNSRQPQVSVPPPEGKGYVVVVLQETDTTIEPVIRKDSVEMMVKIQGRGFVGENHSHYDVTALGQLKVLEKAVNKDIKEHIEKIVKLLQTKYHSDVIGFGEVLRRHDAARWTELKEQWNERHYPEVKVNVQAHVFIEHSGSVTKPFGIKEKELIRP